MRLPGEDELRDSIRSQLASEFQVASRLLDIGTSIFLNPVNLEPDGELDPFELHICLGIVFKACRQYRGIVAVAEISLGDVAESNGRMLLETMLTAEFLMRPVVTLKRGGKQLPDVPGYPLTRLLRSRLYLAHDAASTLKTLRGMASSGDLQCPDADRVLRLAESQVQEQYNEIGPDWTERLKQAKTFSGVSALDLADSLGLLAIYHAFYHPASARIHGSDASRYIEVAEKSDGGLLFSTTASAKGVAEAYVFSSLAMLGILNAIKRRLGLKLDERLSEIAPRIQNMARRLPDD